MYFDTLSDKGSNIFFNVRDNEDIVFKDCQWPLILNLRTEFVG